MENDIQPALRAILSVILVVGIFFAVYDAVLKKVNRGLRKVWPPKKK